jgi:hypothetical protein|tara:strand:+ start:409 stop:894 length:486 start_codon:yes stop_codon:yes gene_type:complete
MKNIILLTTIVLFFGCNKSKKKSSGIEKLNIQEYTCWGSVSNEIDNVYVSYISKNISECNIGKAKIILEKVIGRTEKGKVIFKRIDQINVEKRNKNIVFSKINLKMNSKTKMQEYIVKFYDERKETITKIYDIWKVDYKTLKLKKINIPTDLSFENPDWIE